MVVCENKWDYSYYFITLHCNNIPSQLITMSTNSSYCCYRCTQAFFISTCVHLLYALLLLFLFTVSCFLTSDCSDKFSIPGITFGECCDGRTAGGYSVNGVCIPCSAQGQLVTLIIYSNMINSGAKLFNQSTYSSNNICITSVIIQRAINIMKVITL